MKKICKIIPMILLIYMFISFISGFVQADILVTDPNLLGTVIDRGTASTTAGTSVKKIWFAIRWTLQIVAVAAVIFAGIRYMLASADQKADIKKSMVWLVIGAAITFGASLIINFIVTVGSQMLNP